MKTRLLSAFLICIMALILLITSCSSETTTSTTATQTTTPATSGAQYGGILRVIFQSFPTVFGNPKEWSCPKSQGVACLEAFGTFDANGDLVPLLATSWDVDVAAKTVTFHLREGVKFHDGTDWNAEAAKWNLEYYIALGKLGSDIQSMDVLDEHTLRLNLSNYNNVMLSTYVQYPYMFSPTYIESVGFEASREHPVGTGPFKFVSYQPGASIKFERNDNYWRPELPYLDSVEFLLITDLVVASSMLQADQVDIVNSISPSDIPAYESKGIKIKYTSSAWYGMNPDSAHADSPLADKKVREAVEYAIDRPAIAEALGYGVTSAVLTYVPDFSIMYPTDYQPRTYNPAKAEQLLKEAGYGSGLTLNLIIPQTQEARDIATAIQDFLADVGITLVIDPADTARYNTYNYGGGVYNDGFVFNNIRVEPGVAFIGGMLRDYHGGENPIFPLMARSPEFEATYAELAAASSDASMIPLARELAKQASEDCQIISITTKASSFAYNPKLHTVYGDVNSGAVWDIAKDWFEQ